MFNFIFLIFKLLLCYIIIINLLKKKKQEISLN